MLPISGRPLLEWTIDWLQAHGIDQIAINVHHCPEAITDHFGDGSRFHVHVRYSHEPTLRGTAGAVRGLADFLGDGPFLVVYGDVLTDFDLQQLLAFHKHARSLEPGALLTLSLYHAPDPTAVGLVAVQPDGRVTNFIEKPKPEEVFTDLANAGILVAEPELIDFIPADTFYDFGQHLLPRLLVEGRGIYGWIVPEQTYLVDIGVPERYEAVQTGWITRVTAR